MQLRRLLIPLAFAGAAAITVPSIAEAQPYPPTPPAASVSQSTVVVGNSVTITGTNFLPNEDVSVDVAYGGGGGTGGGTGTGEVATRAGTHANLPAAYQVPAAPVQAKEVVTVVTADANGTAVATIQLTQTGHATITMIGLASGRTASATVLVVPVLPVTGTDGGTLMRQVLVGASATVAGAILIWLAVAWRRRSRSTTAAS